LKYEQLVTVESAAPSYKLQYYPIFVRTEHNIFVVLSYGICLSASQAGTL